MNYIYNTAEMPNNKCRFLFFAEQYYRDIYFLFYSKIIQKYKYGVKKSFLG